MGWGVYDDDGGHSLVLSDVGGDDGGRVTSSSLQTTWAAPAKALYLGHYVKAWDINAAYPSLE